MLYLVAVIAPPFVFFYGGKPLCGIVNFCLCLTICMMPVAVGWAVFEASQIGMREAIEKVEGRLRNRDRIYVIR